MRGRVFAGVGARRWRWRLAGVWALAATLPLGAETPPKPAVRLPLRELGFPGYAASVLHVGASMSTVHILDSGHVLLTYSLRTLVPRLPGDDSNDSDRQVAALLLEVPSGKVLARTTWHLHDHGRYLWAVGHGRFVLRMGDQLSVLMPMVGLSAGEDPLRRYALPHRPGSPVLVEGSPDGRVITVESDAEPPTAANEALHRHRHYVLEFFRVVEPAAHGGPVQLSHAGVIGSPGVLKLAMDGDGYLWAEDDDRGRWTVSFNEFGGRQEKLTPLQSSCHPGLDLLSRSQFLVETCRGSDQAPMLASYGFDGHENWQEPFGELLQPPAVATAPEAGRFAISRLAANGGGAPVSGMGYQESMLQEIRVYGTESGDLLLKVACAPVVKSAENFDLAPDGRMLAVLAPETLDLYRLPELSAKDRKDLAEAQAMTPPVGDGPVVLARITRPVGDASSAMAGGDRSDVEATTPTTAAPVGAGTATADSTDPASTPAATPATEASSRRPLAKAAAAAAGAGVAGTDAGEAAPTPRKPPTLLKAGETPESSNGGSTGSPK